MRKLEKPVPATFISIVLHPLAMTAYNFALLFVYADFGFAFSGQFLSFFSRVLLLSCFIPAASIFFMKRALFVDDYDKANARGRIAILFVASAFYIMLCYLFSQTKLYTWLLAMFAVPLVLLVINMLISFRGRLSLHMVGIGGLIGSVLSVSYNVKHLNPFILLAILFTLAGCLGTARLLLGRDTALQVTVGFLLGLVVSYLCVWVGANFAYLS